MMKIRKVQGKNLLLDFIKTIMILGLAFLASFLFGRVLKECEIVSMIYLLAVAFISGCTTGYIWGVLGSFSALLGISYFSSDFDLIKVYYLVLVFVMLIISIMISELTARNKAQMKAAVNQEERTNKLNEINNQLLVTSGLSNTVSLILKFCVEITNHSAIFYHEDPQQGGKPASLIVSKEEEELLNSSHELFVVHWVFENKEDAGVGTDYSTRSTCTYLPLIIQSKVVGVLGIYCENQKKLRHSDRTFLKLVVSQGVIALEKQMFIDEQQKMILESEKEKMRGNLLRAVSHDLRTPLTGIIGASTTLMEHEEYLEREDRKRLMEHIKEDSTWLLHMVENLLSVTRIYEEGTTVNKFLEPVEEVVAESVMKLKKRYSEANVEVKVPDELLMVPMDVTLIVQVLLNLMENAVKYSKSDAPVELIVENMGAQAVFMVLDSGIGLDKKQIERIFDGYGRDENRSSDVIKGMGIGLSICKTIILAHGGTIEAENRMEGGAAFTFTLPLEGGRSDE
jgi:two-component system sensor histidine kinase KdpD